MQDARPCSAAKGLRCISPRSPVASPRPLSFRLPQAGADQQRLEV